MNSTSGKKERKTLVSILVGVTCVVTQTDYTSGRSRYPSELSKYKTCNPLPLDVLKLHSLSLDLDSIDCGISKRQSRYHVVHYLLSVLRREKIIQPSKCNLQFGLWSKCALRCEPCMHDTPGRSGLHERSLCICCISPSTFLFQTLA